MAATTGSLSAERLPSGTTPGRQKWTYKENIKLMHCFYCAKLDGVGYCNHLKSLWDSRNPAKSAIVTGFAKRGLIHASDFTTWMRHNFACD